MVDCVFDVDNILPLIINAGSILITSMAILAILTHTSMDESLLGILTSFLMANLVAGCVFFYEIIKFACDYHAQALTFDFKISMVLSLAHLLLLILHYHLEIGSNKYTTEVNNKSTV